MARIRAIKPEFFRHHDLYEAEKETGLPLRLAYAGLWTHCDREGRFRWRPEVIKLDALPYDDVDFSDVLVAMERLGLIVSYTSGGKRYGFIPTWNDHQRPRKDERESSYPEPPITKPENANTDGVLPRSDGPASTQTRNRDAIALKGLGQWDSGTVGEEESPPPPKSPKAKPKAAFDPNVLPDLPDEFVAKLCSPEHAPSGHACDPQLFNDWYRKAWFVHGMNEKAKPHTLLNTVRNWWSHVRPGELAAARKYGDALRWSELAASRMASEPPEVIATPEDMQAAEAELSDLLRDAGL